MRLVGDTLYATRKELDNLNIRLQILHRFMERFIGIPDTIEIFTQIQEQAQKQGLLDYFILERDIKGV